VSNEQQRPIGAHAAKQLERFTRVYVARERGVQLQQLALGLTHLRERELSGFARPHLGACEDCAEGDIHAREGHARDASLAATSLCQLPCRVTTRTVGLCVGVTEQPELASHSHRVLRA